MNTKHTPGPWKQVVAIETVRGMVYGINAWCDLPEYNRAQDCRIAEAFSFPANARLIAAAPDLLAALVEIADDLDGQEIVTGLNKKGKKMLVQARAAIARATDD